MYMRVRYASVAHVNLNVIHIHARKKEKLFLANFLQITITVIKFAHSDIMKKLLYFKEYDSNLTKSRILYFVI